ncbi:uncharacterized protein FisN_13Lh156 [Fistulifera solaris]|uniref:Peroxide stress protein YaaA n=1 Tax=Fistulifera solaris TaxID=1519565 RepID=A0A1Z5KLW7_FISSO|nr:uncharacterized protein FisN_13Lh156 [Fistulifera solaris]|eukprot:GAX27276.1 uncharacterized protein FisN_13Lh156 [Fistulifera solaris]
MPTASNYQSGIVMILSPAKTLDLSPFDSDSTIMKDLEVTRPNCHDEQTRCIAQYMKQRSTNELAKLLSLSTTLAQTAASYWKAYDDETSSNNPQAKPCIFAFSGAAYQGLDISTCDNAALSYMQSCLRILDPLYGVLRPLDLIQPYRLEMATKNVILDAKKKSVKLSDYWKPAVTRRLSDELSQSSIILLNLASDEYSIAVDSSNLPEQTKYIKVVFHESNGKVVAVHAKRARGLMVRYLASVQATTVEEIQKFDLEGYAFQSNASDEITFVFQRQSTPVTASSKRTTATATKKPVAKRTRKAQD